MFLFLGHAEGVVFYVFSNYDHHYHPHPRGGHHNVVFQSSFYLVMLRGSFFTFPHPRGGHHNMLCFEVPLLGHAEGVVPGVVVKHWNDRHRHLHKVALVPLSKKGR